MSAQEARELRDAFAKSGDDAVANMDMFHRFPTLEHQFRLSFIENHASSGMIATAIFLAVAATVTALNVFGKLPAGPESSVGLIVFLRLGVAAPALVVIMLAIELRALHRYYQPIVAVAALTLSVSVMAISAIVAGSGEMLNQVQMGDVLVVCYSCLLLGLLARVVVVVAVGHIITFMSVGWLNGLSADALTFGASIIFLTALMTVISSIRLERLARRNFLENRFLNEIAERDGLTGLYNRRKFDELARLVWNQAQREGVRLQLLFIDIDCFKAYNDENGHQAGDECIRQVGRIIDRAARRPLDFCARYGGEEFVLILYGANAAEPYAVAESIRTAIEREAIPHPTSEVSNHITVSIGSAAVKPMGSRSLSGLIQHADEALYGAKQAGRNLAAHEDVDEFGTTGSFEVPAVG